MSENEIKVKAEDVQIGMFVTRLDRPWLETPFMLQGFLINDEEDLQKLVENCEYCYIDLGQSKEQHFKPKNSSDLASKKEFNYTKPKEPPESKEPGYKQKKVYQDLSSMKEEIDNIREPHQKMTNVVKELMQSLRANKKLEVAEAREALKPMVNSIIRNPDALLWLSRLRQLDDYNYSHALGCSIWAMAMGRQLGLTRLDIESLGLGALLLDIGKTQIPEEILKADRLLSEDEITIIKSHVKYSLDILAEDPGINFKVRDMVATHHERVDGSGYPCGLKNEQIPLFGKIAAIVDCYDAITSDRFYAKPMSSQEAVKKIYEWRGKDFQAELVEEFIQAIGMFPAGTLIELTNGEVGVVVSESRTRRLRPKVMLLMGADKVMRDEFPLCDLAIKTHDDAGNPLDILHALPAGSFGIRADDYFL
jgi:HD-GYP domain-containing protein (c-di-GMP phosphodiesterase class II)